MEKELSKEDKTLLFKIKKKTNKCMKQYGLIENNDRILIGLSGGKDSLALTEILGERMKIFNPKFELIAAHISVENIGYQANIEYLKDFALQYNIPFLHRTIHFEEKPESKTKSNCFICSWNRRKTLFKIAEEYHCNKIALGHHQDDILETLLMNMTFQGSFGTMPPLLKMNKFDITIIRPLALLTEEETTKLSILRQYEKQKKQCPFEKESQRTEFKTLLHKLESINPNARHSLWSSMTNIQKNYLPEEIN